MKIIPVLTLFFLSSNLFAQPAGYAYAKQVLIQSSEVSGIADLIDFPMLISVTDNDLRTVANGGHVENSNGYDIVFTEGDCGTILDHEIEKYDPFTGELIVWVKIPILLATIDKGIHMYYGNSLIVADPSSTDTWSVGYDGVWHLHDDFLDASGNGNNCINNGSTDLSPAYNSGDGQNFIDPNDWIEVTNHPARGGSYSYSAWFRTNDRTRSGQRIVCDDASNGDGCHAISLGDPGVGRLRFYTRGLSPVSLDTPDLISNDVWYYVTITYDEDTGYKAIYLDGVLVANTTVTGTVGIAAGNASIGGEIASGETSNRFHGDIDEVRSITASLSADWAATEFNNQDDPASFYTLSIEMSASLLCETLPIELIDFNADVFALTQVELNWKTASETYNDFFTIERSNNGIDWVEIMQVDGAGNSTKPLNYAVVDKNPLNGLSYYRLKQTDFNGAYSLSDVQSVNLMAGNDEINVYPNPTDNKIYISTTHEEIGAVKVYDILGKDITANISMQRISKTEVLLNLSGLSTSIYFIQANADVKRFYKN